MPKKLTKTLARAKLWTRGRLEWKLHSGQKVIEAAFTAAPGELFVLNCSRRFGKTYWLCVKAVECAIRCPNENPLIFIASATKVSLMRYIIRALRAILADAPSEVWPGWSKGYNKTAGELTFSNGATIILVGLDKDPGGIRGNYADLVVLDEAREMSELKHTVSSVAGPLTLTRPGARIVVASTPPDSPDHDFAEICMMAREAGSYVELDIYKNPMMTPALLRKARANCLTETDWQREYLCQFVVDTNRALVPEWSTSKFVRDFAPPTDDHDRYEAMDIGVQVDLTVALFGFWDPTERALKVEDMVEINGPSMTTPVLHDLIRAKEKALWGTLKTDCYRRAADNSHPLLINDLGTLHGLHFLPTGKDDLHAMVNDLRRAVIAGEIIVHPRCGRLIGALESAIWDKPRKAFGRSPNYGHFDAVAALMYMVRNLDKTRGLLVRQHHDPKAMPAKWPKQKAENEALQRLFNLPRKNRF